MHDRNQPPPVAARFSLSKTQYVYFPVTNITYAAIHAHLKIVRLTHGSRRACQNHGPYKSYSSAKFGKLYPYLLAVFRMKHIRYWRNLTTFQIYLQSSQYSSLTPGNKRIVLPSVKRAMAGLGRRDLVPGTWEHSTARSGRCSIPHNATPLLSPLVALTPLRDNL